MSGPEPELTGEVRLLRAGLGSIKGAVHKIVDEQTELISRLRRTVKGLVAVVLLLLVVSGFVGCNAVRLNKIQDRTSNEVLCPLYAVFLRAYHPERQPPEALNQYEADFDVIRNGARKLGCAVTETVPPSPTPSVRS